MQDPESAGAVGEDVQAQPMVVPPEAHPGDPTEGVEHARHAWITRRVIDNVDATLNQAVTWEPHRYIPVLLHMDGERVFAFAKQPAQ